MILGGVVYRNAKLNLVVVAASVLLLAAGAFLDRSQATVGDISFNSAMIPHHSMAITRDERAQLEDVRVGELAVEISEAQRREILEMEWLIEDIRRNGVAVTPEEAASRPVPDFEVATQGSVPLTDLVGNGYCRERAGACQQLISSIPEGVG